MYWSSERSAGSPQREPDLPLRNISSSEETLYVGAPVTMEQLAKRVFPREALLSSAKRVIREPSLPYSKLTAASVVSSVRVK